MPHTAFCSRFRWNFKALKWKSKAFLYRSGIDTVSSLLYMVMYVNRMTPLLVTVRWFYLQTKQLCWQIVRVSYQTCVHSVSTLSHFVSSPTLSDNRHQLRWIDCRTGGYKWLRISSPSHPSDESLLIHGWWAVNDRRCGSPRQWSDHCLDQPAQEGGECKRKEAPFSCETYLVKMITRFTSRNQNIVNVLSSW